MTRHRLDLELPIGRWDPAEFLSADAQGAVELAGRMPRVRRRGQPGGHLNGQSTDNNRHPSYSIRGVTTLFGDEPRTFQRTHPWLTFSADLNDLGPTAWLLLGEAHSKLQHISGVALRPDISDWLNRIYLTKGVHATTAIEGNTLTEEQVGRIIDHDLKLPPSQDYLEQEVRNVVDACNRIVVEIASANPIPLTTERIAAFNFDVLRGLELDDGVRPGEIRSDSVVVGSAYRGAPAEDCRFLLDRLCGWLNGPEFLVGENDPYAFTKVLIKAVLAHLYIAWIHPFGDGNGRTARLIEFQVLVESGVPLPAAHLLSDHYNLTRERYYRVLARTSRPTYPIAAFVEYALTGLVDGLRSQLDLIRVSQLDVTWENYVHDRFRDQETPARRRQKHLALDLPSNGPTPRSELRRVSARIAEEYAGKGTKTITRDINAVREMGLIDVSRAGVKPNRSLVLAFLPVRADGPVAAVDVVLPDSTTVHE